MCYAPHQDSYESIEVFNFIKDLLEIPRTEKINRNFFNLFAKRFGDRHLLRKTKEEITEIFTELRIPELNRQYYKEKTAGNLRSAKNISKTIMRKAYKAMNSSCVAKEIKETIKNVAKGESPYFAN